MQVLHPPRPGHLGTSGLQLSQRRGHQPGNVRQAQKVFKASRGVGGARAVMNYREEYRTRWLAS
jgi:hypothetical protein